MVTGVGTPLAWPGAHLNKHSRGRFLLVLRSCPMDMLVSILYLLRVARGLYLNVAFVLALCGSGQFRHSFHLCLVFLPFQQAVVIVRKALILTLIPRRRHLSFISFFHSYMLCARGAAFFIVHIFVVGDRHFIGGRQVNCCYSMYFYSASLMPFRRISFQWPCRSFGMWLMYMACLTCPFLGCKRHMQLWLPGAFLWPCMTFILVS